MVPAADTAGAEGANFVGTDIAQRVESAVYVEHADSGAPRNGTTILRSPGGISSTPGDCHSLHVWLPMRRLIWSIDQATLAHFPRKYACADARATWEKSSRDRPNPNVANRSSRSASPRHASLRACVVAVRGAPAPPMAARSDSDVPAEVLARQELYPWGLFSQRLPVGVHVPHESWHPKLIDLDEGELEIGELLEYSFAYQGSAVGHRHLGTGKPGLQVVGWIAGASGRAGHAGAFEAGMDEYGKPVSVAGLPDRVEIPVTVGSMRSGRQNQCDDFGQLGESIDLLYRQLRICR